MRLPLIPVLVILVVSILIDIFIYRRMRSSGVGRKWCVAYVVISSACQLLLLAATVTPKKTGGNVQLRALMWIIFAYMSVYLPKIIVAAFMLARMGLARVFRRPLRGITWAGAAVGTAVFCLMWWGALFNRHRLDVREVGVDIEGMPAAFDGYRIVQISDMHVGSLDDDPEFLADAVGRINALRPDLIVFTGDIVNRHSPELIPYTDILTGLRAPDGVYSVMGNHDYGDYFAWQSPAHKQADIDSLQAMQRRMGWRMLNNDHTWLRRGSDSLALIGVENIGDPPFRIYGSLRRAYPDLADRNTKILLSHNPVHWTDSISGRDDVNVALTLSGHTHAMQIELLGISPAAMRYDCWGGLYTDSLGRDLYVNIGLGVVGLPARIGATPEITLITLHSK